MVYIVPGFKEGLPKIDANKRLFLYPKDDIEDFCMQAEATLGSSNETRFCSRKNLRTENIEIGEACVIRIMGYINGKISEYDKIQETVEGIIKHKKSQTQKEPKYKYSYNEPPEMALFEINI